MNLLILENDAIALSSEILKHLNEGWSMVGRPITQIIRGEIVYSQLMKRA